MSIFNELLLPKLLQISKTSAKNLNDELQAALNCLDKFEEEHQNGRVSAKERAKREKALMTTLQSINEDDDESNKMPESGKSDDKPVDNGKKRISKKRSKDEVEGMVSPDLDKRAKRNASVKAQSIISKQSEKEVSKNLEEDDVVFISSTKLVNVNLNQKMRREDTSASVMEKSRREGKENVEPVPVIQIKQEKISLPPEPMDMESLPVNIEVKQELSKDDNAMPPPVAPVPKSRRAPQKEKKKEKEDDSMNDTEELGRSRRTTRTRKQTDTMPPPAAPAPVASARATRASSRASARMQHAAEAEDMPPPAPRPKRTRRKKLSESSTEAEKNSTQTSEENAPASPAEKPRPKRTRRGKNAIENQETIEKPQPQIDTPQIPPKEEISQPDSPVLQKPKNNKTEKKSAKSRAKKQDVDDSVQIQNQTSQTSEEVDVSSKPAEPISHTHMNVTVTLTDMDKTMVLPAAVYNHAPVTPKNLRANETVVLDKNNRETMVLDKQNINDATVVLDKPPATHLAENNDSLLTDDASDNEQTRTPPSAPAPQPSSAVKEKVQKFERLARTTRTQARAKLNTEDDTHTPPDKMIKPLLSQDTLSKMDNLIFNGKPPQVSSASASKPRVAAPPAKALQSVSASKASALSRHRDAAEREKEDARKKKEAMLEAKRELQKKKREEKMANAAAAREAADRERKLAMEAAAKDRMEKQLHADQGKLERLKEVERKKQEFARKVAETEERRKAEEAARQQRLAVEQKKAEALKKKQQEEAEAMKEAALMAKEIEKKQREYLEKQKMKSRLEEKMHTPLKPGMAGYYPQEPVYMADGFQFLNSDEEEENTRRPVPTWSMPKVRQLVLSYQCEVAQVHIDTLFSVRIHSPDLREIFPNIERKQLKRTSSAVWRTPPRLPPVNE